ncbi:exonuclease mut-7 homolog [Plodia interpunctella]|uniref:exonuclease mut-7 homolog n=1 Tax=Plodia interpunctella TaxID=58824 RepID=UPI0023686F41|nr:exonuclease mut-7 homolog [Plodia interpunctella]
MDLNQLVSKNQSIKIVPSVEESLRNNGLDVDLDKNVRLWYEQLRVTWKTWKKSPTVESRIETFFQSIPDPYRVALVFVIKCEDSKDCKPKSLPYCIIETLQKWALQTGALPENSLKLPAFHIAVQQRNQQFLNLMVKAYNIVSIKDVILPIVKDMICNDNCKQASQIVIAMELYDDVPVEDLLFPLILQDKANMIDEYLCECPSQVEPLLLYLDNLLNKKISIREYVQKYIDDHKICHVKYDKIHHKPLGKLVARLCNKFNIPIERCKNLSKNRITGGLRYLIHQRYDGNNVNPVVWDDLVKDSLRQNAGSGPEFIDMLVDYDRNEALKWATYLNLANNDLPLALQEMSLKNTTEETEENWDAITHDTQEYYKSSLISDQIIMIDTGEKFYDMISTLKKCNVVSIDCEWKPSFGATQSQVALVQVAISDCVYLIDTLLFNTQQYTTFWHTFYKSILDNGEIIKLGFGLEQDLKEMKTTIIGLGNIKLKGEGLLDLFTLWKSLLNNRLILPYSEVGGNSLSCLVQACFGLPLEKSEQCSNWEIRPLRDTQVQYAALDAHVLIKVYEFFQTVCLEQGINFEEICNDVMVENKKKSSKKTKTAERLLSTLSPQSKSAYDIKLMVENHLSTLIPYLRYCGIDTTMILPHLLWCDTINLAISEDRFLLLAKLKCTPTVNFPQSSILDIGIGSIKEQLQKVFKHFNISIKQDDLLAFCLKCNNKDLKEMAAKGIYEFCEDQMIVNNQISSRYVPDEEDEGDNYDNFLSDSDGDDEIINMQPTPNLYQGRSFKTNKGAPIEINDLYRLSLSQKTVYLCETCGKLYWEGDEFLQPIRDLVLKLTNLTIW